MQWSDSAGNGFVRGRYPGSVNKDQLGPSFENIRPAQEQTLERALSVILAHLLSPRKLNGPGMIPVQSITEKEYVQNVPHQAESGHDSRNRVVID